MSSKRRSGRPSYPSEDDPQQFFDFEEEHGSEPVNDPFQAPRKKAEFEKNLDFEEEVFEEEDDDDGLVSFYLAPSMVRLFAFLIDAVLLLGTTSLILAGGLYFSGFNFDNATVSFSEVFKKSYFILLFLVSSYFIFFHAFAGKTIGKMIFGIRVIGDDGELLGLKGSVIRWAGYFVSALFVFIGFLWALFDSEGQTWHDKIAGTYVVRD